MLSIVISRVKPYVIEGFRTGAIFAAGDIVAQTIIEKKNFRCIDYVRTIKYSTIGLFVVGPLLNFWYSFLDRTIAVHQSGLQRAVKKVIVDQIIMAPTLNFVIMILVGLLNGESYDVIRQRIKTQYPEIMINNYLVWPGFQLINFSLIPLRYQVVFVQIVAVIWNSFVSYKYNDQSVLNKKA